MRKRFVFLVSVLFCQISYGQTIFTDLKSLEKRADYYYSKLYYTKAADLYTQTLKKKKNRSDYELNRKAALLYKKLSRYEEARKCFDNILSSGHRLTSQDSIEYFNTLRAAGDLKADTIFTRIYSRIILNNLFRDSLYYNIFELPFNTGRSEYCPIVLPKGILFVSEDEDTSLVKRYNALNNGGFAHLYYAAKSDTGWSKPARLEMEEENLLHIGPVAFYEGNKAILNRCMEGEDKPYRLELATAEFDEQNKQWKNLFPLTINNTSYSLGHPAISKDGTQLIFASDKEGGMGGTDLYLSTWKKGNWTEPVNLGNKINTKGDEKYPYLTNDNVLFFSTDGRYGMGGLDIYYIDLFFKDSIAVNMGYPVNSGLDDFGFSFHKETKTGYFSSNRKSNGKEDNLYLYTENKIFLDVTLYDDFDKKELTGYSAEIWDTELNIPIRHIQGDRPNILKANLRPSHEYRLIVHKEDYRNDTLKISTSGMQALTNKVSRKIFLKRKPIYYARLNYKNEQARENFAGASIIVNNRTENTLDTLDHDDASAIIKLDGECEYIITSKNGEKLRYIYVEKKPFKITASIPYYNLYLGVATPSILHVRIQNCKAIPDAEGFNPMVKVWDWVNRNEFNITPGPDGDFQLVVTDSRLFDLYVDKKRITYSQKEITSGGYCIRFMGNK